MKSISRSLKRFFLMFFNNSHKKAWKFFDSDRDTSSILIFESFSYPRGGWINFSCQCLKNRCIVSMQFGSQYHEYIEHISVKSPHIEKLIKPIKFSIPIDNYDRFINGVKEDLLNLKKNYDGGFKDGIHYYITFAWKDDSEKLRVRDFVIWNPFKNFRDKQNYKLYQNLVKKIEAFFIELIPK